MRAKALAAPREDDPAVAIIRPCHGSDFEQAVLPQQRTGQFQEPCGNSFRSGTWRIATVYPQGKSVRPCVLKLAQYRGNRRLAPCHESEEYLTNGENDFQAIQMSRFVISKEFKTRGSTA